jgi:putative aldouronate transport system substrate-binding protein
MHKTKLLMTIVLMASIIFTILTGCASTNDAHDKASTGSVSQTASVNTAGDTVLFKDQVTISYASWDIDKYMAAAASDAVFQAITKKLNVVIKPIGLTYDDYTQKIQMWAASGNLPDVFSIDAVGTQFYRNWINQNIIRPLPIDLSKYPNLQRYLDTSDIKGLMEEGRYYCIPRKTYPTLAYNAVDRLVEYRWDLAQEAGITKEPETWDEFEAMLEAIVKKDPEGKKIAGFTCVNIKQIGGFFWLFSNPAAISDGSGTDYKWIKEDGRSIPAIFSKNALPSLQNMRNMYDRGLIDKDLALTKGDQGYDKFVSGKIAALLHGGGYTTTNQKIIIDRWKKVNPDKNYADCVRSLKPLKSSDGNAYHATFKTYWSESYFNAKMDDSKLDRIMGLYDFLVSDDGHDYLRYGIKGVDYTKSGDKYTVLLNPTISVADKYKAMPLFKEMAEWDQGFPYDNPDAPALDPVIRQTAANYIKYIKENTRIPEFDIRLTYLSTPAKAKFSIMDYEDMVKVLLSKEPVAKIWGEITDGYRAEGLDKVIGEVNVKAKEMGIN